MYVLRALLWREYLSTWRQFIDISYPLTFFCSVILLFIIAGDADAMRLQTQGPSVVWIAALLASLLNLDRLYAQDAQQGALDQWLLLPVPRIWIVLSKIITHWILTLLPLIIVAPLLGIMLHLSSTAIGILVLSLLLGTPTFSALGGLASVLTLAASRSGVLIPILILPLTVPVLIFGSQAVIAVIEGGSSLVSLLSLGTFWGITFAVVPGLTGLALQSAD